MFFAFHPFAPWMGTGIATMKRIQLRVVRKSSLSALTAFGVVAVESIGASCAGKGDDHFTAGCFDSGKNAGSRGATRAGTFCQESFENRGPRAGGCCGAGLPGFS